MKRILLAAALCCAATPALAQDPAAPRVYELAEVETQPVPANLEEMRAALESTYPAQKRAAGQGARVSVAFILNTDGVPRDLIVTESTDAEFDSATVSALALLRFTPATVAGQAVPVRVEVPVQWDAPGPAEQEPDVAEMAADAASPAAEDGVPVYTLAQVDDQPQPANLQILQRELVRLYPPELRDRRIQGLVQVSFVITERGEVVGAAVTSSTDPRFNAATLEAIRALRFRPGRIGGRAVRTQVELPIQWQVSAPAPEDGRGKRCSGASRRIGC